MTIMASRSVRFTGATGAILSAKGMTVTRLSTGSYSCSFTPALPSDQITAVVTGGNPNPTNGIPQSFSISSLSTVSIATQFRQTYGGGTVELRDPSTVSIVVFADEAYNTAHLPVAGGNVASNGAGTLLQNCSVARDFAGQYTVTFDAPRPNANYKAVLGVNGSATNPVGLIGHITLQTTGGFVVNTYGRTGSYALTDLAFSFAVYE